MRQVISSTKSRNAKLHWKDDEEQKILLEQEVRSREFGRPNNAVKSMQEWLTGVDNTAKERDAGRRCLSEMASIRSQFRSGIQKQQEHIKQFRDFQVGKVTEQQQEEEEARRFAEEEARRLAAEEARRLVAEEAKRLAAAEEAKCFAEVEADESLKCVAEEEARWVAEESKRKEEELAAQKEGGSKTQTQKEKAVAEGTPAVDASEAKGAPKAVAALRPRASVTDEEENGAPSGAGRAKPSLDLGWT